MLYLCIIMQARSIRLARNEVRINASGAPKGIIKSSGKYDKKKQMM